MATTAAELKERTLLAKQAAKLGAEIEKAKTELEKYQLGTPEYDTRLQAALKVKRELDQVNAKLAALSQNKKIEIPKDATVSELSYLYLKASDPVLKNAVRERLLVDMKPALTKIQEERKDKAQDIFKLIESDNKKIADINEGLRFGKDMENGANRIKELEAHRKGLQKEYTQLMSSSGAKLDAQDPKIREHIDSILTEAAYPEAKKFEEKQATRVAKVETDVERKQEKESDTATKKSYDLRENLGKVEGQLIALETSNPEAAKELRTKFDTIKNSLGDISSLSAEDIAKVRGSLAELEAPIKAGGKLSTQQILENIQKEGPAAMIAAAYDPRAPKEIKEAQGALVGNAAKDLRPWQIEAIKRELLRGNEKGAFDHGMFSAKVRDIVDAQGATKNSDLAKILAYSPRDQWDSKLARYKLDASGSLSPEDTKKAAAESEAAKARFDLDQYREDLKNIADPRKKLIIQDEIAKKESAIRDLDRTALGTSDWKKVRDDFEAKDSALKALQEQRKNLESVKTSTSKELETSKGYEKWTADLRDVESKLTAAKTARDKAAKLESGMRSDLLKKNPDLAESEDMKPILEAEQKKKEEEAKKIAARSAAIDAKFPVKPAGYEGMMNIQDEKYKAIQDSTVNALAQKYGYQDKEALTAMKTDLAKGELSMQDVLRTMRSEGTSPAAMAMKGSSATGLFGKAYQPAEPKNMVNGQQVDTSATTAIQDRMRGVQESLANAETQADKDNLTKQLQDLMYQKRASEEQEIKKTVDAKKEADVQSLNEQIKAAVAEITSLQQSLASETDANKRQSTVARSNALREQVAGLTQKRDALLAS